ncbi:MAG: hypothetical protein NTY24_11145 [Mycobacterium sp.]|nr:hypothetical protein [Mycobacterium sp.]MCX6480913.1 hypothetical protein [Mycobacterium sp.]
MSLEDELREALFFRNEMAVDLAVSLLDLTVEYGLDPSAVCDWGIVAGRYTERALDIEALTAVILQRAGVPWDVMAARADQSRQALHRRLSARGEELFSRARRQAAYRERDTKKIVKALRRAQRSEDWEQRDKAFGRLAIRSRDLVNALLNIPPIERIVSAADGLASNLVELRQIPRWWEWMWDEDEEG